MTELLEEKCIIHSCFNTESCRYCGEQTRKVAKRLKDGGLIICEEVEGKCNWLRFLGFTADGRKKYFEDNGQIKAEYLVSKDDH